MIVTPFGDMEYGDDAGIPSWIAAHDQRHRAEVANIARTGIPLTRPSFEGDIDADWLGRHLLSHMGYIRFMGANTTDANVLLETDWRTSDNFYAWHQMHNELHRRLDQTLGIS